MVKKVIKDKIVELVDKMVARLTKLSSKLDSELVSVKLRLDKCEVTLKDYERVITDLTNRLFQAEYRLNYQLNPFGQPDFPVNPLAPIQPYIPAPTWPSPFTCSKCGLDLSQPMGYVCSSTDCPTFARVTCGNSLTDSVSTVTVGDTTRTSDVTVTFSTGAGHQHEQ